ncbi:MAG: hypothetical protein Q7R93_01275 [bacterium]|nr:hypothetical protein [bacterium]
MFTTDDAPDVLASFLKQHHQSVEKGEGYLLSLIPRKPEKALEDPYFTAVWGTWIVSFLRFVRSFGRFRF